MVIASHLYVGESLKKKEKKIIKKMNKNKIILGLYLVTNASNEDNQLDIHPYNECFQKTLQTYIPLTVFGIARGKEEALSLIEEITKDCIANQGDCDLKTFLLSNQSN